MKCKKCKDEMDSDTKICGRCVLESVMDVPVVIKKGNPDVPWCGINLIRDKKNKKK